MRYIDLKREIFDLMPMYEDEDSQYYKQFHYQDNCGSEYLVNLSIEEICYHIFNPPPEDKNELDYVMREEYHYEKTIDIRVLCFDETFDPRYTLRDSIYKEGIYDDGMRIIGGGDFFRYGHIDDNLICELLEFTLQELHKSL